MGDRQVVSPERAFAQMNAEIAENLRRVQKRILTPSSTGDTFTAGAQSIAVQNLATPAAPFTTVAQLDVLPGSWVIFGTTTLNAGSLAGVTSYGNESICRLRKGDGTVLTQLDHVDPFIFLFFGVGHHFAPITRATFSVSTTVILEVRISSDSSPLPNNCTAERTRLVVSPY